MAELRYPIMNEKLPLRRNNQKISKVDQELIDTNYYNSPIIGHIDDYKAKQRQKISKVDQELIDTNYYNSPIIGHIDDYKAKQRQKISKVDQELIDTNYYNSPIIGHIDDYKAKQRQSLVPDNKPTTQEDSPKTSIMEALGWGSVHGATLGYDDEIAAGTSSLFGKETYDDGVKRRRDYQKLLAKEHPYAYVTGNLVGGLATLVPAIVGGPFVAGGAAAGRGIAAAIRATPAAIRAAPAAVGRGALAAGRAIPGAIRATPAAIRATPAAVGRGALAAGRAIPGAIRATPAAAKAVASTVNKTAAKTAGAAVDTLSKAAEAKAFQTALAQGATRAEAKLAGEAAAKKAAAKFNLGRAAKIGALYGAIAGSGEGEGFENTVATTLTGGALGGITPFALSGVAPLVTKPAFFLKDALPKWVRGSQPGEVQISNKALREIIRALDDEGIHNLDKALKWKGPDSMIIDLSDHLAARALREAKLNSDTHSIMSSNLGARQAESAQRVRERLNETLGKKVNTLDLKQDIINNAIEQASPLYEKAFAAPISKAALESSQLLHSPEFNRMYKKAVNALLNEGDATIIASNGRPEINMRILHEIKGYLGDQIRSATREGHRKHARMLKDMEKRLTHVLDESSPHYAQARQIYHENLLLDDALSHGQKAFGKNVTLDMIKNQLSGLESKELDAFRKGARSQIEHAAAHAQSPENNLSNLFNTQGGQEKLRLVYGEDKANQLMRALRPEAERSELFARFPRHEGELGSKAGEVLDNVSKADPIKAILKFFTGPVKWAASSINRNVERDIASLITARERGDIGLARQKSVELLKTFRKAEQKRLITQGELVKFINLLNVLSVGSHIRRLGNQ